MAATIGLSAGTGFTMMTPSIFAPHLLNEFGWSKAAFALIATLTLINVVSIPLAGRLADVIGVRRTATIGVVALPISFAALAAITGDIRQYAAIFVFQSLVCVTTTITVYNRVVVRAFEEARGFALAICAAGPALVGTIANPALNELAEAQGWRWAYVAIAVYTGAAGAVAILLLPRGDAVPDAGARTTSARADYGLLLGDTIFWWMIAALLFCNVIQVLLFSQINLLLIENGVATTEISLMISVLAVGVLLGRFLTGLALDHFPMRMVAAVAVGMPAIGLAIILSPLDDSTPVALAVLLLGLSLGAEGDVISFMVARLFGLARYSSVLGLMVAAISLSSALGAAMLSLTLELTGSFALFVGGAAISVAIGAAMFLLLPFRPEEKPCTRKATLGSGQE